MFQRKIIHGFRALFSGRELISHFVLALLLGCAVGFGWSDAGAEIVCARTFTLSADGTNSTISITCEEVAALPSAVPAPAAAQPDADVEFDDDLEYDKPETCDQLGGASQRVDIDDDNTEWICSEIDKNDTFCIVNSKVAFPCEGLFKHVGLCNGKYNRPALNPFFCGKRCEAGAFACGDDCERGRIVPLGRIPYVARGYSGEVFRAVITATMSLGRGRIETPFGGFALTARIAGDTDNMAIVGVPAPAPAGAEFAVTLRAGFACAGTERKLGAGDFGFTVTVFHVPPRLEFKVSASQTGELTQLDAGNLQSVVFRKIVGDPQLAIDANGKITLNAGLDISEIATIAVAASSPDLLGTLTFNASARGACVMPDNYVLIPYDKNGESGGARALKVLKYAPNDTEKLCEGLQEGEDPNADSGLPLANAASRNNLANIDILLDYGANITIESNRNVSDPVHKAAAAYAYPALKKLIERGANPHRVNPETGYTFAGFNALHFAAAVGNNHGLPPTDQRETIRTLVSASVNINVTSAVGFTPLIWAARSNASVAIDELLKNDANADTRDGSGLAAIHYVNSEAAAMAMYNRGVNINLRAGEGNKRNQTPLRTINDSQARVYLQSKGATCGLWRWKVSEKRCVRPQNGES